MGNSIAWKTKSKDRSAQRLARPLLGRTSLLPPRLSRLNQPACLRLHNQQVPHEVRQAASPFLGKLLGDLVHGGRHADVQHLFALFVLQNARQACALGLVCVAERNTHSTRRPEWARWLACFGIGARSKPRRLACHARGAESITL